VRTRLRIATSSTLSTLAKRGSSETLVRAESCDEQQTGGRPEFVGIGRDAGGGIEAGVESLVELAEILTHAVHSMLDFVPWGTRSASRTSFADSQRNVDQM
jgi:hypothetical protein